METLRTRLVIALASRGLVRASLAPGGLSFGQLQCALGILSDCAARLGDSPPRPSASACQRVPRQASACTTGSSPAPAMRYARTVVREPHPLTSLHMALVTVLGVNAAAGSGRAMLVPGGVRLSGARTQALAAALLAVANGFEGDSQRLRRQMASGAITGSLLAALVARLANPDDPGRKMGVAALIGGAAGAGGCYFWSRHDLNSFLRDFYGVFFEDRPGPVIMEVWTHYDDEVNAGRIKKAAAERGAVFHSTYLTRSEGGKRVRVERKLGRNQVQLDPFGKLIEDTVEDKERLSLERERETIRYQRTCGVARPSTIRTLVGNPDIDPFALPPHLQDEGYLLGEEGEDGIWTPGQWKTEATLRALVDNIERVQPDCIWTMAHDPKVHQGHRAGNTLAVHASLRYAAITGNPPIPVFGARENGWYPEGSLLPLEEHRCVIQEMSPAEMAEKSRDLQRAFLTQRPGHPDVEKVDDNSVRYNGIRPQEVLVAAPHTSEEDVRRLQHFLDMPPMPFAGLRQAIVSRVPQLAPNASRLILESDV
jgi:LmbE family N-acetylglucosaminyl deacetylase